MGPCLDYASDLVVIGILGWAAIERFAPAL